jgi:hypothetical protein
MVGYQLGKTVGMADVSFLLRVNHQAHNHVQIKHIYRDARTLTDVSQGSMSISVLVLSL